MFIWSIWGRIYSLVLKKSRKYQKVFCISLFIWNLQTLTDNARLCNTFSPLYVCWYEQNIFATPPILYYNIFNFDWRKKEEIIWASPPRKKILYHLPFFHFKCEFHLLFKFNLHRVGGPSSIEHRKANCTLFKIYFGGAHHSINGNNFFKDVIF